MDRKNFIGHRHRRSPSSDRFLDVFSPPSTDGAISSSPSAVELNEDDVFYTNDFSEQQRSGPTSAVNHRFRQSFRQPEKFGILAALPGDHRNSDVILQKPAFPPSPTTSLSRDVPSIPKPNSSAAEMKYSQSMPIRRFQQSAPVRVPMMARKPMNGELDDVSLGDDVDDEEVLPPHEIVARGSWRNDKTAFSVVEGVGRTLKGRDLRQVRNAVWRQTGTILPGYRFYPTQEELVSFYLQNKLNGTRPDVHTVIPVVNIYDHNPWDLPKFGGEFSPADGEQWFFFSPRQEREYRGGRPNRMTNAGYWKATGSPSNVYSIINNCSVIIGMKRTMVFYLGRAPNGTKTTWKMNEYKAVDYSNCEPSIHNSSSSTNVADPQLREEVSLCRIYTGSRSIRAFDRRPTSEPAAEAVHHHSSGGSSSSSSSPPAAAQNINTATDQNSEGGGEPCWDADQLFNWFFT